MSGLYALAMDRPVAFLGQTGAETAQAAAGELSSHFSGIDWAVMLGYLGLVSVLGVVLAGKQKDMQDFFRGGDKLPWYAVSASLIATTISAVTFVGVPAIAFAAGGNMTYLQLGLIAGLISRIFISFVLVPAYYAKRIYSPYDYMGDKLGGGARGVTTGLFTLGGVLAQSSRVYLTAIVLELVMAEQLAWIASVTDLAPLVSAIILIGLVSVAWTMLGGIATVVWTDALLFFVFVSGGIAALWVVVSGLPGGFGELIETGKNATDAAGNPASKFELFKMDQAFSLTKPYTLAAAGFAVVVGNIGAYGTDQLLAQRIFCCKNKKHAQLAMLSSYVAEGVAYLMLLVGVGLFAFYTASPEKLFGAGAIRVAEENDKIFPVFILQQMPVGIKGLVIAGVFAAAISSLTSILAALSQTTISAVYLPARARKLGLSHGTEEALMAHDPREGHRIVSVSRGLIVFWGIVLCLAALVVDEFKDATGVPILDLALGLASYIVGGLFAAFMLAWLPIRVNGRGLVYAAPLGVLAVFGTRFHEPWAIQLVCVVGAALMIAWLVTGFQTNDAKLKKRRLVRSPLLMLGIALVIFMAWRGYFVKIESEEPGGEIREAWFGFGDPEGMDRAVLTHPDVLGEDGRPVIDPQAAVVMLEHPITRLPLLDASGDPIPSSKQPKLKDMNPDLARPATISIAWPWYAPIGGGFAFFLGWALADRREEEDVSASVPAPAPEPELAAQAAASTADGLGGSPES